MQNFQWIVSVCNDLAEFAEKHGLPDTKRAAQQAAKIASLEINCASLSKTEPAMDSLAVGLPRQDLRVGYAGPVSKTKSAMAARECKPAVVVSLDSRRT